MKGPSRDLRRLVWLYFWLLLFEGALRKWILPGLSGPLLIIRDPVAIAIYAVAMRDGVFPRSGVVWFTGALAALCFAASFAGVGNLKVTLYGLRADFLHLPLIMVLPRVLSPKDVRQIGFSLLAVAPLMALISVRQFIAGPNSSWNVGAGGEIGGQLYAAQGKVRTSGTFSFATGIATYLALCSAVVLNDLLSRRAYPRWLTIAALFSLVLNLAISGSRSAVIGVGVVCAMILYMAIRRKEQFGAALRPLLATFATVLILSYFTPVFKQGVSVLGDRFSGGGGLKEGIAYRTGGEYLAAWDRLFTAPIFGIGLGVGTNAGAAMLSGHRGFSLGEGELERVIMESGPILGGAYIGLRVGILLMILNASLAAYRQGRILPLLLVGVSGLDLATAQFGQSTALGFTVFISGLTLAACAGEPEAAALIAVAPDPADGRVPGRSPYAEWLHGSNSHQDPPP